MATADDSGATRAGLACIGYTHSSVPSPVACGTRRQGRTRCRIRCRSSARGPRDRAEAPSDAQSRAVIGCSRL